MPLGRAFSYAVPEAMRQGLMPGMRVLCEFGRRKILGVVLELTDEPPKDVPPDKLKPLLSVIDDQPALPEELLRFLVELAGYYLAPIGEVMRLALPAVERSHAHSEEQRELLSDAKVNAVGRLIQVAAVLDGAPAELSADVKGQARDVFQTLKEQGPTPVSELQQQFSNARAAVKRLVELNVVGLSKQVLDKDPFLDTTVKRDVPKTLSPAQAVAVDAIKGQLTQERAKPFLLHGVTGSGKTEVYLQSVAACLERGQGAIVLVPEIALTPQLVSRFRARFGDQIAVVHSALTENARHTMWRRLREGEFRVAVGARSALFAPVQNLSLICVDEEHDGSFKQEEGVRYHARDMALLRAHRAGACCVLGSATPSLSSESLVKKGKLVRLTLPDRVTASSKLPEIEVINLRQIGAGPSGHRLLSLPLHRALEQTLEAKQQSILFLNRRGFAPSVICESCGEVIQCPNCAVALTVHRARGEHLRCHYCDYAATVPEHCPKCKGRRFAQEGIGTEKVEHALKETFPEARIARLDRDVAQGIKSEKILNQMRDGEIDILVGTQMVTKGHDLPNVTLVGVLNADAALSLPDYQAAERTFHLLVQVAGRAGRGESAGRVLIQTRQPDHPAIRYAISHDTQGFVQRELAERHEARYPPACRMLMVRMDSLNDRVAQSFAAHAAQVARSVIGSAGEILGPTPAPIERLRNRFRYRFVARADQRAPLYRAAHAVMALNPDRRVRCVVDIDPVSML